MQSALVIGGTGFVGRHTVEDLRAHGYDVTVMSRRPEMPARWSDVRHLSVDREDDEDFRAAADRLSPDVVIDCALFHPDHVRTTTEVFGDVSAYVYVSSGGVYDGDEIPKREEVTPLHAYRTDHGSDRSMATYGPRKAECDRRVRAAADAGFPGMSVRPTMIYGPKSLTPDGDRVPTTVSWAEDQPTIQHHHEYWIDRLRQYDRVVVPGDGTAIWHRVYVEDVAAALRRIAEGGTRGEAYNVADERILTMEDVIDLIAATLGTTVEVVHASRRELARVDLDPDDFVLYHHLGHNYPHVLATCKLRGHGWRSTPVDVAMERTVAEASGSDRDWSLFDPGRDAEERLLDDVGA